MVDAAAENFDWRVKIGAKSLCMSRCAAKHTREYWCVTGSHWGSPGSLGWCSRFASTPVLLAAAWPHQCFSPGTYLGADASVDTGEWPGRNDGDGR